MRDLIDLVETLGIREKKFWIDSEGGVVEVNNHDIHMEDSESTREEAFENGYVRLNISQMSNGHSEVDAEFEEPATYLALRALVEMISDEVVSRYQINNNAFDDQKQALMFLKKLIATKRQDHLRSQQEFRKNQLDYVQHRLDLARKFPDKSNEILKNYVIDDQAVVRSVPAQGRPLRLDDLERPYSLG